MEKILRIPFAEIDTADLLVDAVYEGGTAKNLGSEVLSKVMHVGNSGGFRKCMKLGENGKKAKDVAYVCIIEAKYPVITGFLSQSVGIMQK